MSTRRSGCGWRHWACLCAGRRTPAASMKSALDHLKFRATDAVGAATIGLSRKFIDPRDLPSVDQAEMYDDDYLTGS